METKTARIDKALFDQAAIAATTERRSANKQIEYWAAVGRAVIENPNTSAEFIQKILIEDEKRKNDAPSLPTVE